MEKRRQHIRPSKAKGRSRNRQAKSRSRQAARRSRPAGRRKDGCRVREPALCARRCCRGRSLRQEPSARLPRTGGRRSWRGSGRGGRAGPSPRADAAAKYEIPVFATVDELLAAGLKLDAASVAVPTVHHHAVASALLDAGLDLLVEKPLATSLAEADDLIARAERGSRILQPGHLERFNPAVLAVQPQLRRPMFFEAHRLSVFTPRSLDVDVVLDLMVRYVLVLLMIPIAIVTNAVRIVGAGTLATATDRELPKDSSTSSQVGSFLCRLWVHGVVPLDAAAHSHGTREHCPCLVHYLAFWRPAVFCSALIFFFRPWAMENPSSLASPSEIPRPFWVIGTRRNSRSRNRRFECWVFPIM